MYVYIYVWKIPHSNINHFKAFWLSRTLLLNKRSSKLFWSDKFGHQNHPPWEHIQRGWNLSSTSNPKPDIIAGNIGQVGEISHQNQEICSCLIDQKKTWGFDWFWVLHLKCTDNQGHKMAQQCPNNLGNAVNLSGLLLLLRKWVASTPMTRSLCAPKMDGFQWLFLVPLKGGRWHIIPQLAVYKWFPFNFNTN